MGANYYLRTTFGGKPWHGFDPIVRKHIRNYILKSKYIDYAGKNALSNIPIIGGLLSILFGPLWDTYYSRNIEKKEKRTRK